jgi:hypothetical protein
LYLLLRHRCQIPYLLWNAATLTQHFNMSTRKPKKKPSILRDPQQEHPLLAQSRQFQGRPHQSSSFRQRPILSHPTLVHGPIEGSIDHDGNDYSTTRRFHHMMQSSCNQNPACCSMYRKVQNKMESSEKFRVCALLVGGLLILMVLLHSNTAFLEAREKKGTVYHRDIPTMQLSRLKEEQESHETTVHHAGMVEEETEYIDGDEVTPEVSTLEKVTGQHMLDTLSDLGMLDSKHDSDSVSSVLSVVQDADKTSEGADLDPKLVPVTSPEESADGVNSELLSMNPTPMREPKATVGYVVTLLECNDEPVMDGAAVLARSIMMNSVANPKSSSNYGYKLYAIVHTGALPLRDAATFAALTGDGEASNSAIAAASLTNVTSPCIDKLAKLGYDVLVRDTPIRPHEIKIDGYFKENVDKNAREYIKLYSYGLTGHPIVVHMDFPTMVLNPLDELFDAMLDKAGTKSAKKAKKKILFHENGNNALPDTIDAYYTRDYTTIQPGKTSFPGLQQGLLVVKPSQDVFDELMGIIRSGNFTRTKGWGNVGTSNYLGSLSTKGLLSYYYSHVKNNTNSVELNRCFYNSMSDTPRTKGMDGAMVCRDGRSLCQDCRTANIDRIRTANLSICRKPWKCFYHDVAISKTFHLCRQFERKWFEVRQEIENTWAATVDGYTPADRTGTHAEYEFLGNCIARGEDGYIPMKFPS